MQVGTYPTRNFAQVCYCVTGCRLSAISFQLTNSLRGLVVSASLCMSPCSSDCIFVRSKNGRSAYSL
jgi:hypothetical protein